MRGWTEQLGGVTQRTIWRCDAELCGAQIRADEGDDRRREHDRQFHLLRAERGGPMDGYDLYLDGKEIGYVYKKRQTYNLVRYLVSERWIAVLGKELVGGEERLRDTMSHVVRHLDGAKAWGQGKNPSTWIFPEESR